MFSRYGINMSTKIVSFQTYRWSHESLLLIKLDFAKLYTDFEQIHVTKSDTYRKVCNIRRTKCQHLNDSRLVL